MTTSRRAILSTLVLLAVLAATAVWFAVRRPPPAEPPAAPAGGGLSELAEPPDWSRLDSYQGVLTRAEFELLFLTTLTTGDGWREFIRIDDDGARIVTGAAPPQDKYLVRFRSGPPPSPAPRYWRAAAELPPAPPDKPLDQVRIALDPGHLGGGWAVMEERNFAVGSDPPIREGDLTLTVARLLVPRLRALGATPVLVRDGATPVTPLRPADLLETAAKAAPGANLTKLAERLFYRTAEIRARAELVNTRLKPDLLLCLHFNAAGWGSPANPILVDDSHFHLLVNGAYGDGEIALADQRFALLHRLLQGTYHEEVALAQSVAPAMAAATGLPAFRYPPFSNSAREIPGEPYIWARNLLANRLYECPVVFPEPYLMNSRDDYARLQAGDYAGLREINGRLRPSIFREYADSLTEGLKQHFLRHRKLASPTASQATEPPSGD